ncbi:hypothetical protein Tco_0755447 [Tanacetum coccineum]
MKMRQYIAITDHILWDIITDWYPRAKVPIVPADPIVALEVGAAPFVSPTGVLILVDYSSSSDSDPSDDSLPPAPDLPLVSPFLCSDDSEVDAIPVRPGEAIPLGRSYCTHLNGPCKLLTVRKRVGPIPARRLAWRCVSHHSRDHHSLLDSSSSGSPSDHSLSGHTPPDTTDADTSTPLRFVHRSLAKTPRCSEALRPPTPANLLPHRKRFRDSYSPENSGEEHMEVDTANAEAVADVGISNGVVDHTEDGVGMGVEIAASDVREEDEEFEAEASVADTREIIIDPLAIGDSSESSRGGIPDLKDTIYDIVHYMSEVRIDRITKIDTTHRQLETSQLVAGGERELRDRVDSLRWHMALWIKAFGITFGIIRHGTMTITHSGMTPKEIEELINRRIEEALAAYEEARAANALEAVNQSQNGNDGDNGNGGNVNGRENEKGAEMKIQMRMLIVIGHVS